MKVLDIINTYSNGEPIFLNEINYSSKNYLRQEFKRLTDSGVLERVYNGVYYKKYKTILGTEGGLSINKYINKMYLNNSNDGFFTGLTLLNKYGFTTQMPSVIEVCSNFATTTQRKLCIDGYNIIVYKPYVKITKENMSAIMFLDLMTYINKYAELKGNELKLKLKEYVKKTNVNFNLVKEYISFYPLVVYKNIYEGGLMKELCAKEEL